MVWILWAACRHEGSDPPPGADSVATDSADTAKDTASTTYTCGEVGPAPELDASSWSASGVVYAGGIDSIVAPSSGYPVYAGGATTGAWRTDDASFQWRTLRTQRTHTWAEIGLNDANPDEVYHSSGGVLWRSEDGGESFTQLGMGNLADHTTGEVSNLLLALAVRNEEVYGVLQDGTAAWSPDRGDTVEARGSVGVLLNFGAHYNRILAPTPNDANVYFTDGSGLYRSKDGMWTWEPLRPDVAMAYSLAHTPGGLLVGTLSGYAVSVDGGSTWTEASPGFPVHHTTVTPAGHVILADGGSSFVVDGGALQKFPVAVEFLGHVGERLVLGASNGTWYSDDLGQSWVAAADGMVDTGMAVVAPHPLCPNRVLIGSRCTGGIYRSDDFGSTWGHVDEYFHYVMGIHYDPRDVDRIWAVSDDSLLRSDDGGLTWGTALRQYHFHGFAVDPRDSERLLIGSVGEGSWADVGMHVYESRDGGVTWADSSVGLPAASASAHTLVFWPDDPQVVLLGTYKGGDVSHKSGVGVGLYRSTDGGASWALADLPEVDIAWLQATGDGVWAATGTGLYHSGDEGLTWTRADAPQDAYLSVAFHGDLGLAFAADGSLVRTDDAGLTWYGFDAGLPPVSKTDLAQVAIAVDGETAYVTHYDLGMFRVAL